MKIRDLPKVEAILRTEGKPEFVVLKFENYKKFIQKCDLQGRIDEADYINRYPDVQKSIREKKVPTATKHYVNTGYVEQRAAKIVD